MNFGMLLLALFFVGASIFGIFAIAASAQAPIVDTFGTRQSNATNQSQGIVQNTTAPLMGGAGGIAIIIAVFVIFIAVVFVIRASFGNSSYNTGRR
jgi:hypothetical protein